MSKQKGQKRVVLLAVMGLTPQVVTETLDGLVNDEKIIPTEIHVITTGKGAEKIKEKLLDSSSGMFYKFCEDHDLKGKITFSEENIHLIRKDEFSNPLDDITTDEENIIAGDAITQMVAEFCADENTQLLVSMAGGRKTMGFYAAYALSLYGHLEDRLYHVLVSPSTFESSPEFYYRKQTSCKDREKNNINPAEAKIMLSNIPFVRMAFALGEKIAPMKFSEAVQYTQEMLSAPLNLEFKEDSIVIARKMEIKLPPQEWQAYCWLAYRYVKGMPPPNLKDFADYKEYFLIRYLKKERQESEKEWAIIIKNFEQKVKKEWITVPLSRVRTLLKNALINEKLAQQYLKLGNQSKKGDRAGYFSIPPEAVHIPSRYLNLTDRNESGYKAYEQAFEKACQKWNNLGEK